MKPLTPKSTIAIQPNLITKGCVTIRIPKIELVIEAEKL